MKRGLILIFVISLLTIGWVKMNHETYPLPPAKYEVLSKKVNLKFRISNADLNSVELVLNEGMGANNYFVLFDLSDDWVKGNFGIVLKGMGEKSMLTAKSGKKPDISRFEKSNSGEKVNFYSFDQVLVKDEKGINYIQMSYAGSPMPLIQSLKVDKTFRLPRHVSARFVNNQNIEFQAGSYGLDPEINGFWIPVKIL